MQKTSNYNLNQWDADDPIRREDFNADNAAIDAALGALSTAVGAAGNCRIATGSYTGTGRYGESKPNKLTFDFKPLWVMVARANNQTIYGPTMMHSSVMLYPLQAANSTNDSNLYVTWTDNSVSWYCDDDEDYPEESQNNISGYVHYWVALGVDA